MNTSGYGDKILRKSVTVFTDDNKHPELRLTISAYIETFANIKPKKVYLRGLVGTQVERTVNIIPTKKYPFKIIEAKAANGQYIRYKLEEDKNPETKGYLLTIENLKDEKGPYFDTIDLKTDNKIRPVIQIRVYGNILSQQ